MDKRSKLILAAIMLLGAILRVWGIGYGLPYQFHQDEPMFVNHALAYGSGDLNPHYFILPPFTSYILFFFYAVYFLLLNLTGVIKGTDAFIVDFLRDPTPFYIIGRVAVGLIPSLANIYLAYKLASKFFSAKTALFSALFMAVTFLNVVNAHYIYADNLLVFFTLLAYIAMAAYMEHPSKKACVLAAIFTGLAVAAKYNAAMLAVSFLIAHMVSNNNTPAKKTSYLNLLLFICVMMLFFVIGNPYSVLDWRFFLSSVPGRIYHTYTGWSHHIKYSLFEGMGCVSTVTGIAGLCGMFMKKNKNAIFFISFPVLFYLHLVFMSQQFTRYVIALVPFLAMGLGYIFFDWLYAKSRSRPFHTALILLSCMIAVPTAAKSITADALFSREDTRMAATRWIEQNIPVSAKIALDDGFFTPRIKQAVSQLKEKYSIINRQPELAGLKGRKLGLQIRALQGEKTYNVYYINSDNGEFGQFLSLWPPIKNDLGTLKQNGVEYVVINNMAVSEDIRRFQKDVAAGYDPIARFSPYKDEIFRRSYDEVDNTCIPIAGKELFSRGRFGPYLMIYKIK